MKEQHSIFSQKIKKISICLLAAISLSARADLVITITESDNNPENMSSGTNQKVTTEVIITQEDSVNSDNKFQEKLEQENNPKDSQEKNQEDNQTDAQTEKQSEETKPQVKTDIPSDKIQDNQAEKKSDKKESFITSVTKNIVSEKDVYNFEIVPNSDAKIFQIQLKMGESVLLNKYYYSPGKLIQLPIKLTKGYGLYQVIYSEYDSTTVFRNKTVENTYEITYKKTQSNYKPKVSYAVQSNHPDIVKLANEITAGEENDFQKVKLINAWITQHVVYNNAPNSYSQKNDALTTLNTKTGICMGYANLFAALARAAGLETKVMTGRAITGGKKWYHQWNEVKADDTWYFIDTTWNAGQKNSEHFFSKADNYPASHMKAKEVKAL